MLFTFAPLESFEIVEGKDKLRTYNFNTGKIDHQFCEDCGVQTFGVGKSFGQVGINISCLEGVEVEKLEREKYDGKNK